jgi:hypothetical protein
MPDSTLLSPRLGLTPAQGYKPVTDAHRIAHLAALDQSVACAAPLGELAKKKS